PAGHPSDPESASDGATCGERVARGRHDAGFEADVAAGLDEEALRGRHDPVVVGELRQRNRARRAGEPMAWWQSHGEGLLEQIDSLSARELAALCGGVLVAEGDIEPAAEQAGFERARGDLAEQGSNVAV